MDFRKLRSWQRIKYLLNFRSSIPLVWHLLWDKRVPAANKGLFVLMTLLYFAFPTDLLPDFIPVLGQVDDLGVLLYLANKFIQYAPANVVYEYSEV
ncbi:MAG TPA: DUF1232 domain-containing protein [Verrucomicrobiae bacterium]|nr:DUF1232 domain-containing protein [Verrucomicrobiae bacterium]